MAANFQDGPPMAIMHDFALNCSRRPKNVWGISDIFQQVRIKNDEINIIQVLRWFQGAVSIRKTVLPGMAIPMLKIRRPNGRLIFNMEIAIRR